MNGFLDGANVENLNRLLDIAKEAATQSDMNDPDETISNEDSKFDAEEIHLNEMEITDAYVSLLGLV